MESVKNDGIDGNDGIVSEETSVRAAYPDRVFRFCPACGAEGFAVAGGFAPGEAGNHRFDCPACGFRFYINASVGTAAILVNDRDELLMVRRLREPKKGTLDLPGGFAAPGERSEDAVKREVKEEVNLTVTECRPWHRSYCNEYVYGGITYFTTDFIYICKADDWENLAMSDPDEAEPLLVPADVVEVEQIGLPSIREAANDLFSDYRRIPEDRRPEFRSWIFQV
jgi:NAD+ diphosphatase